MKTIKANKQQPDINTWEYTQAIEAKKREHKNYRRMRQNKRNVWEGV